MTVLLSLLVAFGMFPYVLSSGKMDYTNQHMKFTPA